MKSFGYLLKTFRESSGLTQGEVAEALGIKNKSAGIQYVSNMERNKSDCSPEMALKFSKILKIPVREIAKIMDDRQRSELYTRLKL